MKPKIVLTIFCALTLLAVSGALALGRRAQATGPMIQARTFEVRGLIRSLDRPSRTLRIAHDEVPGYMPAMTMPFAVRDAALLEGLAAGDPVQFTLAVTGEDSWISRIARISATDPAASPAVTPDRGDAANREIDRVEVGEIVPDFELIDQTGRPVRLSDFRGKAVVLTFIYTRCPLPNYCPLMSKNFADLQQRLSKDLPKEYQLLSVSMDPQFDRPEVLRAYASRFGANLRNWAFATGDGDQIKFVAGLMGLHYEWENGLISHDLRTALIGPDGRLAHVWKSNQWTPYEVHRRVRETLPRLAQKN